MSQDRPRACLVPLDGGLSPAWLAAHALHLARHCGMTLVGATCRLDNAAARAFQTRSADAGVPVQLMEAPTSNLRALAAFRAPADVLLVARTPDMQRPRRWYASASRAALRAAARPVWVALPTDAPPAGITLAFHGQRRAFHALERAATFARAWDVPVDVVVVEQGRDINEHDLRLAQLELLTHHVTVQAARVVPGGDPGAVLSACTRPDGLLVMGAPDDGSLLGIPLGHTVDDVLRAAQGSVLVCP